MKKIIFIIGPTAVGKSEVAMLLAKETQGEIVSCDAMQVYKEINIASNKPAPSDMKHVRHHLIDIVSISGEFNVAQYNQLAIKAIKAIQDRNNIPIVTGGSGMYMKVLLDGIFETQEKNLELRQELTSQARFVGIQTLYAKLKDRDPEAAKKIHPNDIKRVIRALEVCMTEKKPISQLRKHHSGIWGKYDINVFGLNRERSALYQGIDERVDKMFKEGVVEEVEKLEDTQSLGSSAERIIGVQEIRGYLRGEYDMKQAGELMKQNTRRFAKRQLTWFRKEKRIDWIILSNTMSSEQAVGIMVEKIKKGIS